MAFSSNTFYPIAHGNGQTTYVYQTADAIATVIASDYFGSFSPTFNKGDIIIAVTSNTGTIAVDVLVVSSATGASPVTVTNGT